jgi:NADH:ubiquinone oxidoreductase subunit F (NADH-binding)/(2Fe-2S) ferredoxin
MHKLNSLADLSDLQQSLQTNRDKAQTIVTICGGTGCRASESLAVIETLRTELTDRNLADSVQVRVTGCHGFCEQGPLIVIDPANIFYCHVTPGDIAEIVTETVEGDNVVDRLCYTNPATKKKITTEAEIPFYKAQGRVLLAQNRQVDPVDIKDYLSIGGYSALAKALGQMEPEEVIDEVKTAGLRGRGGGGFATGRKWQSCHNAEGYPKYVLCNGDEGDPGAFMDRSIMEGNPHSVLEGMAIGAYAIGSDQGYIYVRLEYPLAVDNLRIAIAQAEEAGLLGKNILGTDFSFTIQVSRGAGAFVCGESTALMASIEGLPGEPRAKHIHTAEKGLFGKPTNLNNVETWANVPHIVQNGAEWFNGIGTEKSKGTKVFSLVGKINNTGLVEAPMGTTLREMIFDIGGGIPNKRSFKAIQTGGPSGGCLPESQLDLPVDYDQLDAAGSMMGSGGMIVMDDHTCIVEVAKYFTNFLKKESCGKCTACREGVLRMHELLEKLSEGKASIEDLELLEEISEYVRDNSICGLGKSAPNPTLSTLRYFRDEYVAHVEGKCPAGVCKALTTFVIETGACKACGMCVKACPVDAISDGVKKVPALIDQEKCITCGLCRSTCKFEAVATPQN